MNDVVRLTCLACGQANRVPVAKLDAGPKCAKCGTPLAAGDVTAFDARVHDKATQTDELPLIVDYWAPWCGPCRMMAPEFSKAASALQGKARFAKIDTEQFPQISQRLQIRGIPLLILYHRGAEIGRLSGARPAAEIEDFVRRNL
ncbi:Thioredoxin-2 [Roseovarius gaetbuli]|uniref:Thioredoxin-2 n=1 Tax=Roseovarius gaetbuli TaxID=1356575 RepID=A0A1X7A0R0_9RHOB|nr:thioredoxin domain-containing protein [Roseovarius gaetbuli]SLN67335.1 Thioredoxin-2 [Roseovarius gaetbuli]